MRLSHLNRHASSLLLICMIISSSIYGQKKQFTEPAIDFSPRTYMCYKAESPLTIDGKQDEPDWQHAPESEDFVDIEGSAKPLPRHQTWLKMLWDDEYFYFYAELKEPHVWAKLMQRDTVIYYDNDFEIFIDPNGDTHQYYEFEINAFGTEWDLFLDKPYRDAGSALHAWDIAGVKSAIHVEGTLNDPSDTDKFWSVEIAIPWKILKEAAHKDSPPNHGDQWRVNFSRVQWQTEVINGNYVKSTNPETGKHWPENNWVWSPQGLVNMHYPEMWGYVQFSGNAMAKDGDTFIPSPDEAAKWTLRQVYYRQQTHRMHYGTYTMDINALSIPNPNLDGYAWPPKMVAGRRIFEAALLSEDGKTGWRIIQDGRTYKIGE